jgi:hypothetical protein
VRWLLAEWPEQDAEPVKYWLASLPAEVPLERLVGLAKLRWRGEHDYRELKDALGLDHFEGRSFKGWHHHVTLASVAHGFLTLERLDPKRLRRPDHSCGIAGVAIAAGVLGQRVSGVPAQASAVDSVAAPISHTYLNEVLPDGCKRNTLASCSRRRGRAAGFMGGPSPCKALRLRSSWACRTGRSPRRWR